MSLTSQLTSTGFKSLFGSLYLPPMGFVGYFLMNHYCLESPSFLVSEDFSLLVAFLIVTFRGFSVAFSWLSCVQCLGLFRDFFVVFW